MRALLVVLLWACLPAAAQTVVLGSSRDAQAMRQVQALAAVYDQARSASTLPPGEPWRPGMALLISEARTVLLLWSADAAVSPEVGTEWRMALANPRARVVPVLLDCAPLPAELAALQWVDWAGCAR